MTRLQNNYKKPPGIDLVDAEYSTDNDINVSVITFAVSAVVLILVAIFFVKTYAAQKQEVFETLRSESLSLERFCRETSDYNLYILKQISENAKRYPDDFLRIEKLLKSSISSPSMQELFAWKEFSWIDASGQHRISSKYGVMHDISAHRKKDLELSKTNPGKVIYSDDLFGNNSNAHEIQAVMSTTNEADEYIGTAVITYDTRALGSKLSSHKNHDYTNFVIINKNDVEMQSKLEIAGIGIEHGRILDQNIDDLIHTINESPEDERAILYLDLVTGTNYHIKKVKGESFILLVNVDKNEIRATIFRSIVMKFLEISIFASMFLVLIIAIYKRETWLRAKTEKAYQVAVMATKAKSDFLAFTAHEIRSPLGFIMTGSELMLKKMLGPLPKKYLEYLEGIHKSASLILEFINDILDEEHIIAGNFKIVEIASDISEIVDAAIKQNKARYANRQIDIIRDIDPMLPLLICDSRRILQVINNILSNCIKYSPDDANINIKIKMRHGELVIKIRDQGIGMTESEIKIALTKYGTVHKAPFSLIEQYGLGLAIVKLLLDAHEAMFCVESEVDVGTTVTIVFPSYKLISLQDNPAVRKDNEA